MPADGSGATPGAQATAPLGSFVGSEGLHRPRLDHEAYDALVRAVAAELDSVAGGRSGGDLLPPPSESLLVALDVDGTILDSDGSVSERVMASVGRLRARGAHVVVSTGRGVQAAMPVVRHLGLTDGWVVCANGAVTLRLDEGLTGGYEVLEEVTFDPAPALDALAAAVPGGILAVELPGARFRSSAPFPPGELIEECEVVDLEALRGQEATRVILRAPGMALEEFTALVAGSGLHSVEHTVGWTAWLDVAPEGVTKASALQGLVDRLGLDASCVLAVGDGANDVEMVEWAGCGVVMGSAPQWVQERADVLTAPVWHDGAAAVMDALMEREREQTW